MARKGNISLESIINLYNKGFNTSEIAEELGCTHTNISNRLHKAGYLNLRDYSKRRLPSRANRHIIDLGFFENIDNQDKAYFLGLMFSDGSVNSKCNQFYLKLKDEDVILKFKEVLKCDYPVIYREFPNKSYALEVSSKKMCSDLILLGCAPNKTKVLKFPSLREDLIRHFIRGFFDGDGCLQLHDKIYHCRFDIACASKQFLEIMRPYITSIAKTNGGMNKESKYDVWHLSYSGHQVKQILDWLYKDANYYMQRKYIKYQLLSSLKTG